MKKFVLILAAVLTVMILVSCATTNSGSTWYNTSDTITLAKRAEATNTVWFNIFGTERYPLAEEVALANGISRLATVEHKHKVGVFGLWTEWTTVITGE